MSKMKTLTTTTASVIALGMVLSACGSGNGSGSNEQGQSANSGAAPAKKEKIVVAYLDNGQMPASEGTPEKNRWVQWINEKSPVEVSFVAIPVGEQYEKYNVLFASGSAPDLIQTWDPLRFVSSGQAMPLDDVVAKYSKEYKEFLKQHPEVKNFTLGADGKQYTIGLNEPTKTNHTLFIRNDWLKKLNLKAPATPEELLNVAKAFVEQDPDGNGKKDTLGIGLSDMVGNQVIDAFYGTGLVGGNTWTLKDGKLVYGWDNIKAATDFKRALYEAGTVDKDYLTDKNGATEKQNWISGKLGIYGANVGATDLATFQQLKKNNPAAEIVPISIKTQFGEFSPIQGLGISAGHMFVNAASKKAEAIMKYLDFMVGKEAQMTLLYGIEGTHYNMANGCPVTTDKFATEVSYNIWYRAIRNSAPYVDEKCNFTLGLDKKDPVQKEMALLYEQSQDLYLKHPLATPILNLPAVPQELSPIVTNQLKLANDLQKKAIASGSSFTTDQAIAEMKKAWDNSGGKQVEDFYNDWYAKNKSIAVLNTSVVKK